MNIPQDHQDTYILDDVPRVEGHPQQVWIDVYFHDTVTGNRWVHTSEYGNIIREDVLLGEDFHWEKHDVFHAYWWIEGNMSCDCNRSMECCSSPGPEYDCNLSNANRKIRIEKITPKGFPDVILAKDE